MHRYTFVHKNKRVVVETDKEMLDSEREKYRRAFGTKYEVFYDMLVDGIWVPQVTESA